MENILSFSLNDLRSILPSTVVILQLESGSNSDSSYEAESSDADDSDADEHWVPNEKKVKRRSRPPMSDMTGMHRSPRQMQKDIA